MISGRILVVDDKEENLYFLKAVLEASGFEVDCAANGADGLDLARKRPPALVVADILMPVMDGFAMCRQWMKDDLLRPIPFVFYTATYTDQKDRDFALSLGAAEFIVKPQEPDVLLEQLQNVLGRSHSIPAPPPPAEHGHDETAFLEQYNQALVRKLESKMEQLEKDIAERKKVEADLRASQERFRSFVENANDVVFALSPDGAFSYVSPKWEELLGHSPVAVVGQPIRDFMHPDDASLFGNAMSKARSSGAKISGFEYRMRHAGGGWRWHSTNGVFLPETPDRPAQFLGIARDVTPAKEAEAERDRLQAQLNQMQKIESVGRLAGGVAHDFNNMLQAILGHVELALGQAPPQGPLFEDLSEIQKAAVRSAELTRQLLAFARKQTISPKILDLNKTVEGLVGLLRRLIGENVHLHWHPAPSHGLVKVDPSQIDQILTNLCINARDALPDGGNVTVETGYAAFDADFCSRNPSFLPGEFVMLAVADDGIGMDEEILSKIFEPFFTTKEVGKGTGLGLATVYGIVKQNRGFIDVASEPGRGSVFKVFLPLHSDGPESAAPEPVRTLGRGKETILLVEDESSILSLGKTMLLRMGYQVLGALLPGEAIRIAETHPDPIDLLITDVVMPEMDGRELAKNLLAIHPGMKRIFMSGYTSDVIAHHGILDEGVQFIEKPFTMATLAAKIRSVLDAKSGPGLSP